MAVEGEMNGREFLIPPPPRGLIIGRDPGSDVALVEDMMVSRRHAQILCEGRACVLHDRDSVNGVFVNDRRVMCYELQHGDVVRICNSAFRFIAEPGRPLPDVDARPVVTPVTGADSMQMSGEGRIGDYQLEGIIGRGGMSVVYKGYDGQRQPVAIKVLDVDDDYIVRKFIQEGQIGQVLREHPNICAVHDSGRAQDNRFYIVMEYVEGASLREYVGQPLTEAQVVSIIGQACDALHYAHLQNIVHRDIKPENILVMPNGHVKVTDFGIAKLTSSVTVTSDRTVGTPEYISPEQARAQGIAPPSDIYSLGVVLYELLVGQPPFPIRDDVPARAATLSVLVHHIQTPPMPPSRIRPVAPHLEQIALRALAKDPRQRFGTAWEMAQALNFQRQRAPLPTPNRIIGQLVLAGDARRISLASTSQVLGRSDIAPHDEYISSKHLSIYRRGDQLWVRDISRNGTWINGERVFGEAPVKSGDIISVGTQNLRIEL
jgi:serine/threonine-protein kinase